MDEKVKVFSLEEIIKQHYSELRVAGGTDVRGLATQVLRLHDEGQRVALSCIGAAALAQGVKALGTANGEAATQGRILAFVPTFDMRKDQHRDGSGREVELTALRLIVARIPLIF